MITDAEDLRAALIEVELLRSREARVRNENSMLFSILGHVQSSLNQDGAIPLILGTLEQTLECDAALLVSVDVKSQEVLSIFSSDDRLANLSWSPGRPLFSAARSFATLDPAETGMSWPAEIGVFSSLICAPTNPGPDTQEALVCLWRGKGSATPEHLHLLKRAAAMVGQSLVTLRLERRNAALAGALTGSDIPASSPAADQFDPGFQAMSNAYIRMADAQALMVDILGHLLRVAVADIDLAVQQAIERLGLALGLDRVCFFVDAVADVFDCEYHWSGPLVPALAGPAIRLRACEIVARHPALAEGKVLQINCVADLDDDDPLKGILLSDKAESALIVPLISDSGLIGLGLFKSIVKPRLFLPGEANLFQSVSSVVGSLILRKEAEQTIAESQAELFLQSRRLRATLNALPDLVIELDDDGRMTGFYSDRMSSLIDEPDRFIGNTPEEVMPRRVARAIRRVLEEVSATGKPVSAEFPLRLEGHGYWFRFTATQHSNVPGRRSTGYLAVIRDVSKDRQQNEEIERLGSIARRTSNLVIMTNTDREIVWVNEAFERRTGYRLEDALGKQPGKLLQGKMTDPATIQKIREALNAERDIQCEILNYDRDGQSYWVEMDIQPSRDAAGKLTGYMAVKTDITERKRRLADLERAERQAREDLAAATDASRDGIAVTNAAGNFVYMNHAHQELFCIPSEEFILGRNWSELYTAENLKFIEATVFPVLMNRGSWKGEITGRRFDGTSIEQEVSLTLKDDGGIVCITRDIGERLQAESERTRVRETLQLAQRREALGQMAAGLAHDFNNLIASIAGSATLIQRSADRVNLEHADRIVLASQRASELVKRLLARGQRSPERRYMRVDAALGETVNLLRSGLNSSIQLNVDYPAAPLELYADPTDVLQVLLNLAVNARDALQQETGRPEIRLSARLADPDDLTGRAVVGRILPDRRYVLIEVADNGVGMDEATCQKVFQPYFTTKGDQGSGLGLVIVSSIVDANSGAVVVKTRPDNGTCIQVFWPQDPVIAAIEAEVLTAGKEDARLDGRTILIVDDNEDVLQVLTIFLEGSGAEVASISDPSLALEAIQEDPGAWDLLVTDFDMTGMNGAELAIAAKLADPGLPVVLVTAFPDWRSRTASGNHKVFDHIVSKPIAPGELVAVAASSVRKRPS